METFAHLQCQCDAIDAHPEDHEQWQGPDDDDLSRRALCRELTHFKSGRIEDYAWLPDGKIVFQRSRARTMSCSSATSTERVRGTPRAAGRRSSHSMTIPSDWRMVSARRGSLSSAFSPSELSQIFWTHSS